MWGRSGVSKTVLCEQMDEAPLTPLQAAVAQAFAPDGPLAQNNPGYTPRVGQLRMAQAVAEAVEARACLVVEAGTGIGKTFAYLVPALLSGRQVLVCTATKTLQDQLYTRDLPLVARWLGVGVRSALLKGRSSYLCLERLGQARHQVLDHDRYAQNTLRRVEEWAAHTPHGDLSDAGVLPEHSPLWPLVTSTRDNCLGNTCPRATDCHVYAARRRAVAADVVVANHHLFWADRQVREVADGGLLPIPDLVVFDEAHHLLDTAARWGAEVLSGAACREWGRDCLRWASQRGGAAADWTAQVVGLEMALTAWQSSLPAASEPAAPLLAWASGLAPDGVDPEVWSKALGAVHQALTVLLSSLESASDDGPTARALRSRGGVLLQRLAGWVDGEAALAESPPVQQAPQVRWVECSRPPRLVRAPLSLSGVFGGSSDPALVFTSATLGVGGDMSWFAQGLGLGEHACLHIHSPFDHAKQAALYIPTNLPLPEDPSHARQLAAGVWPWVQRLRGRTLVLATTTKAVQQLAQAFEALQRSALDPRVLAQGAGSKTELLERFRAAAVGDGAVLVATSSFWEGVDLQGDVLQLLVIDKLPFPPPDDPWVQARWQADEAAGLQPFRSSVLPSVAVALRQGVGRLIRSETDRGLVVIGDRRLAQKSYGAYLRRALPPMTVLPDTDAVHAWVDTLMPTAGVVTTSSTTDLSWF